MSASSKNSDPSDDDLSTQKPSAYKYDLRLEIGVKNDGATIPVVAIFYDLVRRLKEAADDGAPLAILTATDKLFNENQEMASDEFQRAFMVDNTEGKSSKVLLGFKMHSLTKLSDLKRRLMHTHLIPHNLFLREQVGGFHYGVKSYLYGFLQDEHPDHPEILTLGQRFDDLLLAAWKKLGKDERDKWRKELPQVYSANAGLMLPVNFTKERISATHEEKEKIITTALMVSTPKKFGKLFKVLLDIALAGKKLNSLIPFALSRDNPNGYYYMVAQQAKFIDNHRNIPIMSVPVAARNKPSQHGQTLLQVLNESSLVHRVAYDYGQEKYHVSTTASKYRELHQWIYKKLEEHQFSYGPNLRTMKYGNNSGNGTTLSYSDIFKDAISVASESYAAGSAKTTPSNAWKSRPPLAISYELTDTAFPAFPPRKQPTPATPSTTSETLFDEDTIQSAISVAIKKLEEQHQAEMKLLKQEMQSKIDEVANQMKELGQQVATQTYQALVKDESPLVTKMDHAHLQQEIAVITTQLSTIINMFQQGKFNQTATFSETPPYSPARVPANARKDLKKRKPAMTPEKLWSDDDPITQDDQSIPSATSSPDEGMEGCED